MNRQATVEFVTGILDGYQQGPVVPLRAMRGTYLPSLEAARATAADLIHQEFGHAVPMALCLQEYTWSDQDRLAIQAFVSEIEAEGRATLNPEQFTDVDTHELPSHIGIRASNTLRQTYRSKLGYDQMQPVLTLDYPVAAVPEVRYEASQATGSSNDITGIECVTAVFGMTALQHMGEQWSSDERFGSLTAFNTIDKHTGAPTGAVFDLPWLANTLGSGYVEASAGKQVRTIVTAGADLGEIEQKIIKPLTDRDPDIDITLSAILTSETVRRANHAVAVIGAEADRITVRDPRYGTTVVSPELFWSRWVPTNMQAVVSVAQSV